jgi:GDPmannose 4,6-dehydratase
MEKRKALITGATGQDGSYLAELLLSKDYEVHATVRRAALEDPEHQMSRIHHLLDRIVLHSAALESYPSLFRVLQKVRPDEFYHLAAQSFVSYSFEDEFSIINANVNGTHYALSATRECAPHCRFYFAGSSEMFGRVEHAPQNEGTQFHPRSVYGISKCAGFELTRNYRESYGMHATIGILYNHESPRRGFEFVTRKICNSAARIKMGLSQELKLGNLEAKRDWGHAKEYVDAMWKMVQQPEPNDYVIATGKMHTVREFCDVAFSYLGLDYQKYVVTDPKFYRPAEAEVLQGDSSRARQVLGWEPKIGFVELVQEMVEADYRRLKRNATDG